MSTVSCCQKFTMQYYMYLYPLHRGDPSYAPPPPAPGGGEGPPPARGDPPSPLKGAKHGPRVPSPAIAMNPVAKIAPAAVFY
jgi:hypothetical protein